MSITFDDVSDFIWTASSFDLSRIADEIVDNGYEFECSECETYECEEHDSSEDVEVAKRELLQSLARRLDQFGLDDMLEELKSECELVGVNLKIKVTA